MKFCEKQNIRFAGLDGERTEEDGNSLIGEGNVLVQYYQLSLFPSPLS